MNDDARRGDASRANVRGEYQLMTIRGPIISRFASLAHSHAESLSRHPNVLRRATDPDANARGASASNPRDAIAESTASRVPAFDRTSSSLPGSSSRTARWCSRGGG